MVVAGTVEGIERVISQYDTEWPALKAQGLSQSEIARAAGVSRQRVSLWFKRYEWRTVDRPQARATVLRFIEQYEAEHGRPPTLYRVRVDLGLNMRALFTTTERASLRSKRKRKK
jgi:transcriptional regulator with XRE-family HTH domain